MKELVVLLLLFVLATGDEGLPLGDNQRNATKVSPSSLDAPKEVHTPGQLVNETTVVEKDSNNSTRQQEDFGNSGSDAACCIGRDLRSCLSLSGDGSHGMLSLTITSHGVFNVKITPPSFLHAEPSVFVTKKEESKTIVNIEMLDPEAAKRQTSSKIAIDSEDGHCEVEVPSSPHSNLLHGFSYSAVRSSVVGFGMLGLSAAIILGVWAYCQCKDKRKHPQGPSYQELEMGDRDELPTSLSSSQIPIPVNGRDEGWDEVWDDDWEDTEAGLSRSPDTKRKPQKDGWKD